MQKVVKIILILCLAMTLNACAPIRVKPTVTYSIMNLKATRSPIRAKTRKTILVSLPVASPGYQSNKMIYENIPYRLLSYVNNEWVAPPANMLLPLIAQSLRNKGYFKAVVTSPFSGVTTYRLDTQLLMLQQEFLQPVSQVRLMMQVTLINNSTDQVIASKRFQIKMKAPENNPYSGVLATNKAASQVTQQISNFVINAVR